MPISSSYLFKAVLWDMDGTLVNTEVHWLASEEKLMEEVGYVWTEADQRHCLGGPLTRVGEYMFKKSGNQHSPTYYVDELIRRTTEAFETGIELMPGVRERLLELSDANVPMALVTASPRIMANKVVESLEKNFFRAVVSADDVSVPKPDPEGYILAARLLGVDVSQALIFEDSNTGVRAARASGASVVAIRHLNSFDSHPRTVEIDSMVSISGKELNSLYIESC